MTKRKTETVNQYLILATPEDGECLLCGQEWPNSVFLGIGSGRDTQAALADFMQYVDLPGVERVICWRVQGRSVTVSVPQKAREANALPQERES